MDGCLAWQREGLGEPEVVRQATAGYRAAMDVVGTFLQECCKPDRMARPAISALYGAFDAWRKRTGEQEMSQRAFGQCLAERGYERARLNDGKHAFKGLSLIPED